MCIKYICTLYINFIMNEIDITKKLITFKTVKNNFKEHKKCLDYVVSLMPKNVVYEIFEQNNIFSVVFSFEKKRKYDLILNAHLDVVPAKDNEFTPKIKGDKLYGRGAKDDKGPASALISAFIDISKLENKPDIALLLTFDEEIGGENGLEYLVEKEKYMANLVIIPDGGDYNKVVIAQKGVLDFSIEEFGKASHGSRPWTGVNAIEKAMENFYKLKKHFEYKDKKNHWEKSINLGKIEGGTASNKVPDSVVLELDIRLTENDNKDEIMQLVKKYFSKNAKIKILAQGNYSKIDQSNKYLKMYKDIIKNEIQKPVSFVKTHGASDSRFFGKYNVPVMLSYVKGSECHIDNEWASMQSIKNLKNIIYKFCISYNK